MTFEIPTELVNLYEEGIDSIITAFGETCRLYYPPAINECPNCILDTFNNTSSNRYKSGGPSQFNDGVCPYCNGIGYINTDVYEDIQMLINDNPKNWIPIGSLMIPAGGLQTRAYMIQYPKLQQCIKMRLMELKDYDVFEYERIGTPIPFGLTYRWVITNWKRI